MLMSDSKYRQHPSGDAKNVSPHFIQPFLALVGSTTDAAVDQHMNGTSVTKGEEKAVAKTMAIAAYTQSFTHLVTPCKAAKLRR